MSVAARLYLITIAHGAFKMVGLSSQIFIKTQIDRLTQMSANSDVFSFGWPTEIWERPCFCQPAVVAPPSQRK